MQVPANILLPPSGSFPDAQLQVRPGPGTGAGIAGGTEFQQVLALQDAVPGVASTAPAAKGAGERLSKASVDKRQPAPNSATDGSTPQAIPAASAGSTAATPQLLRPSLALPGGPQPGGAPLEERFPGAPVQSPPMVREVAASFRGSSPLARNTVLRLVERAGSGSAMPLVANASIAEASQAPQHDPGTSDAVNGVEHGVPGTDPQADSRVAAQDGSHQPASENPAGQNLEPTQKAGPDSAQQITSAEPAQPDQAQSNASAGGLSLPAEMERPASSAAISLPPQLQTAPDSPLPTPALGQMPQTLTSAAPGLDTSAGKSQLSPSTLASAGTEGAVNPGQQPGVSPLSKPLRTVPTVPRSDSPSSSVQMPAPEGAQQAQRGHQSFGGETTVRPATPSRQQNGPAQAATPVGAPMEQATASLASPSLPRAQAEMNVNPTGSAALAGQSSGFHFPVPAVVPSPSLPVQTPWGTTSDQLSDKNAPAAANSGSAFGRGSSRGTSEEGAASASAGSANSPIPLAPSLFAATRPTMAAGPEAPVSTPDHTPQTGQAGTSADRVPGGANAATSEVDAPLLTHARLVQTMSGSQMQVNLRSEDFGRITIHAGYQREAISAQITLDNPQLGASLASHVSAMEQKLAEDHGLRTSITVTGAEAGTTSSGAQGGTESEANQRRPFQQFEARAGLAATLNQQASPAMTSAGSAQSAGPRSSGRLNITI